MSVQHRKERDRARRHALIVTSARTLAETEGWDAVTTRRLAERIEYSQPVLYSHFRGKEEIVAAVALDGIAELTAALRAAAPAGAEPRDAIGAVAAAYVEFAERHPAVYDAMFTLRTGLLFADDTSPAPLREAFAVLADVFGPAAGTTEPGTFTEVAWAALHGLATLTRAGRLSPPFAAQRLTALVERLGG